MLLQFLATCLVVQQVLGQNSALTFNWKFRTDFVSQNLPSCFPFDIIVMPNPSNATAGNFSGIPPYYMLAFPENGQPITTLIGTTNDSLSWTPTHPVGTKLILQLMDSVGNTGGTAGQVFQIQENSNPGSNNCIAPTPPMDFTISSNITGGGNLETCQPWRLNIDGGISPYTVVLDARNSPVLTNITVPGTDNAVVYINRADPGTVLFAGVVDATGRWATGTQFVSTSGSTDASCIGFATITTNQNQLNAQEAALRAVQNAKRRTSIIIGVVVSLVLLLLIVSGVGTLLYLRRKKARELEETGQDTAPRQFTGTAPPGQVLSGTTFVSSATTTPTSGKSVFSPEIHGLPYTIEPFNHIETVSASTDSNRSPVDSNLRSRPSFANFPATSIRRSKGQEAAREAMSESNGTILTQSSMPSDSSSNPVWPVRSGSLQNRFTAASSELIFQHRDAGQVVRELPPPYLAPPEARPSDATESESRA